MQTPRLQCETSICGAGGRDRASLPQLCSSGLESCVLCPWAPAPCARGCSSAPCPGGVGCGCKGGSDAKHGVKKRWCLGLPLTPLCLP